jgi:HK97 family phage portal protein
MGILARVEAARIESRGSGVLENPQKPLTDSNLISVLGGMPTTTGIHVNERSAMQLSVVYACVRVLSESLAALPWLLHRRLPGGGKERALDHPLYKLIHDRPNPELSSFNFRELLEVHRLLYGNAFAEIETSRGGQVIGLWPLLSDRTQKVKLDDGKKVVITHVAGQPQAIAADRVLHIPGLGFDGLNGLSPIKMAAQAIGVALAAEEFAARWFGSGARPSMILSHPAKLSTQAAERIRESAEQNNAGLSQSHRIMVLEEAMKAERWGVPANEAQFIETQKWQADQIARVYRVPPHKVGLLDRATNNNIEHQDIEFVRDTLLPTARRWEQPTEHALLRESERDEHDIEFLFDALLRGDSETRHKVYAAGRQWGYFSANDVREMENLNPIEGGNIYMMPVNMVPADQAGKLGAGEPGDDVPDPDGEEEDGEDDARQLRVLPPMLGKEERQQRSGAARQRLRMVYEPLFRAAAERVVLKETKAAMRMLKKAAGEAFDLDAFMAALEKFYAGFPGDIRAALLPVMVAFAEALRKELGEELNVTDPSALPAGEWATEYAERYAAEYIRSSRNQLAALAREVEADQLEEAFGTRIKEWGEGRAPKEALGQSVRFAGALALATYSFMGVIAIRWLATGKSCPLCQELNGRVTTVTGHFVRDGDTVDPQDGQTAPLVVKHFIRHPPLHGGCDCTITSA